MLPHVSDCWHIGRTQFCLFQHLLCMCRQFCRRSMVIGCCCAEPSRASDWENVVACHRGLRKVTTWTTHKSTMGRHKLDCKRFHHGQNRQTVAQVGLASLTTGVSVSVNVLTWHCVVEWRLGCFSWMVIVS